MANHYHRQRFIGTLFLFLAIYLSPGTVYLHAQCCRGNNLLKNYNPDFSGNYSTVPPGFENDNVFVPISTGPGYYSIMVTRNHGACYTTPQFDHTTGDYVGRFLWFDTPTSASAANPAVAWTPYNPSKPVGQQNLINVTPNTDYLFSAWVRDLGRNSDCLTGGAPLAGLRINGVDVAQVDLGNYTSPCCPEWKEICVTWNSGTNTQVLLEIESRRFNGYCDLGVDDVFFGDPVTHIDTTFLGNDTSICLNKNLTLSPMLHGASYTWSDASTDTILQVSSTGKYWVEALFEGCLYVDTIQIYIETPAPVYLGQDTIICPGKEITLDVTRPLVSYLWQDNSTSPIYTIRKAGVYWVEIDQGGCKVSDTIVISFLDTLTPVDFFSDTSVCPGEEVTFSADTSLGDLLWNTGERSAQILTGEEGLYWVRIDGICNSIFDSAEVRYIKENPPVHLPGDTSLCIGTSIDLPGNNKKYTYHWIETNDPFIAVNESKTAKLEITDRCFTYNHEFFITAEDCQCILYIPNSFTPNSDELNSAFSVYTKCDLLEFRILIYNRWGELIYSTEDPDFAWDGKVRGEIIQQGMYVYRMRYVYLDEEEGRKKAVKKLGNIFVIK